MSKHAKATRRASFRGWATTIDPFVRRLAAAIRAEIAPAVQRVRTTGVREVVNLWHVAERVCAALDLRDDRVTLPALPAAIGGAARAATKGTGVRWEALDGSGRTPAVLVLTRVEP